MVRALASNVRALMKSAFQRYLLPGLVFQSICIGGGYGTGREIAEFFLTYGPLKGLLGLALPAMIIISVASVVSFELARMFRAYDYRQFLQLLLGRAWFLYEIAYLFSVALVLAVVGAAIGSLINEGLGVPGWIGTLFLMTTIAILAFKGTHVIEGIMSAWSFVLYAVYAGILVLSIVTLGPMIKASFSSSVITPDGWLQSGLRYGALQCALLPAVLFASAHIKTRSDAVIAGVLTGPLFLLPAGMFFFAMLAHYPAIMDSEIPVNTMLEALNSPILKIAFPIVLIGTFIETGTGMIHAFNERVASAMTAFGRSMPNYWRAVTAAALLSGAMMMSRFGIIDLIAVGYGALTWVFIVILIIPLLTVGIWKIVQAR
jgi:uncharacterized membrane protein YkvI